MTDPTKATRATIQIGGIEIEPDPEKRSCNKEQKY